MPHTLEHFKESVQHVEEVIVHEVEEVLFEPELIEHSHHKKLETLFLWIRNVAVAGAVVLFVISLFDLHASHILKAIAYFFGAAAYICEIVLLTDCFTEKVPHNEMFMAYCFGPLYILLGVSYLLH